MSVRWAPAPLAWRVNIDVRVAVHNPKDAPACCLALLEVLEIWRCLPQSEATDQRRKQHVEHVAACARVWSSMVCKWQGN